MEPNVLAGKQSFAFFWPSHLTKFVWTIKVQEEDVETRIRTAEFSHLNQLAEDMETLVNGSKKVDQ